MIIKIKNYRKAQVYKIILITADKQSLRACVTNPIFTNLLKFETILKQTKKFSLLKSPHVHKRAQNHFGTTLYICKTYIQLPSNSTIPVFNQIFHIFQNFKNFHIAYSIKSTYTYISSF
jgi:hypothetical protein